MLDTTIDALEMMSLNRDELSREQLEILVENLSSHHSTKRTAKNDISLIADLDDNCFRYAHSKEVRAMKQYIDSLKEVDYERKQEIEDKEKELKE